MKPTNIDLRVISYIAQFGSVEQKKILARFPDKKYKTESRLRAMSGLMTNPPENYVPALLEDRINYMNAGTERSVECFRITEAGLAALKVFRKHQKRAFWHGLITRIARFLPRGSRTRRHLIRQYHNQ